MEYVYVQDIEKYLAKHKDSSLQDFIDQLEQERKDKKVAEENRKKEEEEYYKNNYAGKYVRITFYSQAFLFCGPLPKTLWDLRTGHSKGIPSISIYLDEDKINIDGNSRKVNDLWLNTPYSSEKGSQECVVINQNTFSELRRVLIDSFNSRIKEELLNVERSVKKSYVV